MELSSSMRAGTSYMLDTHKNREHPGIIQEKESEWLTRSGEEEQRAGKIMDRHRNR